MANRFDIMADLTFAEPLHMLQGSAYSPWVAKIFASIKIAARMRVLSDLPFVGWILPSLLGRLFSGKKVCLPLFPFSLSFHFLLSSCEEIHDLGLTDWGLGRTERT